MRLLINNRKWHTDDTDQTDEHRFIFLFIKYLCKSAQSESSACHLQSFVTAVIN